ncbi:unnamed protein product [Linum trigynum]|uniref:Uncharacterized protein n=1 Tax=Linum trigynum TaxID=586398 RepID=A0AAV2C767_9ROSI
MEREGIRFGGGLKQRSVARPVCRTLCTILGPLSLSVSPLLPLSTGQSAACKSRLPSQPCDDGASAKSQLLLL